MRSKWEIQETIHTDISIDVAIKNIKNRLLQNRKILSIDQLNSSFDHNLSDPFLLPDMKKVVNRISKARNNQETIGILGDFDMDGLSGTALLYRTLQQLDIKVIPYIPDRISEGHGLSKQSVDIFKSQNTSLIITVDCGSDAIKEVEYAYSLGIETIITDHHTVTGELPKAIAIVNPLKNKSLNQFNKLTGAGLAYKLSQALFIFLGLEYPNNLIQLAALGTIGDVAPLIEENRYIVKKGIEEIKNNPNPGIQAIIELNRFTQEINSELISFQIIPKLNAAGRLENPHLALEILLTNDYTKAKTISRQLDFINDKRKFLTDQIMEEALNQIDPESKIIFLENNNWPIGIIGLVANKIQEQFNKPAFIISTGNETSRGSARCPETFNLVKSLEKCSNFLENFGGHPQAAGFSIKNNSINEFRKSIEKIGDQQKDLIEITPKKSIDCNMPIKFLKKEIFDFIKLLEPFGKANPEPIFMTSKVYVTDMEKIGSNKNHLRLKLKHENWNGRAIGFNLPHINVEPGDFIEIIYHAKSKNWSGKQFVELQLIDLKKL